MFHTLCTHSLCIHSLRTEYHLKFHRYVNKIYSTSSLPVVNESPSCGHGKFDRESRSHAVNGISLCSVYASFTLKSLSYWYRSQTGGRAGLTLGVKAESAPRLPCAYVEVSSHRPAASF